MPDSPKAVVRRTLAELRRAGRPERAKGAAAYFKSYEKLKFFGVDAPTVRRMAGSIAREQKDWSLADALTFAEPMIARPELEAKGVGICLLGAFRDRFTPAVLPVAKGWLQRYCTDWASTDNLCGDVLAPFFARFPGMVSRLHPWRNSRDLYVRRASAVALVPHARRGAFLDEAYDAALALGREPHHLLQKAAGWLLREAGKTDMARLERFLREHGRTLGRTTVGYAIERFPAERRAALLAATRAPRQ
jgi:3-methyladenine DNA glycosylase AlkD